jgi:hypothetical protein
VIQNRLRKVFYLPFNKSHQRFQQGAFAMAKPMKRFSKKIFSASKVSSATFRLLNRVALRRFSDLGLSFSFSLRTKHQARNDLSWRLKPVFAGGRGTRQQL